MYILNWTRSPQFARPLTRTGHSGIHLRQRFSIFEETPRIASNLDIRPHEKHPEVVEHFWDEFPRIQSRAFESVSTFGQQSGNHAFRQHEGQILSDAALCLIAEVIELIVLWADVERQRSELVSHWISGLVAMVKHIWNQHPCIRGNRVSVYFVLALGLSRNHRVSRPESHGVFDSCFQMRQVLKVLRTVQIFAFGLSTYRRFNMRMRRDECQSTNR